MRSFKKNIVKSLQLTQSAKYLYLEHYTGAIIQSSYYNDDSIKTVNALRKALVGNKAISPEFDIDGFLEEFGKVLIRSLIQEVEEEKARARKEEEEEAQREQQKKRIQEEITILEQKNQGITFEQWTSILLEKYQNLKKVVEDEMPEIWPSFEFELSISRILKIGGCDLPFIGIILGRPSSYKTVVIEILKKWYNTYYTDNFTARSFVSHSTSVDADELEEIDMLPKIRNRLFLTPELSPMFTTKEEDLIQLLGLITRLADGHGYLSDSGAHGHRGYDEDIMFTWIGAAVDIPYRVYKILNNLGHRLYFFRTEFPDEDIEELTKYANIGEKFKNKKERV